LYGVGVTPNSSSKTAPCRKLSGGMLKLENSLSRDTSLEALRERAKSSSERVRILTCQKVNQGCQAKSAVEMNYKKHGKDATSKKEDQSTIDPNI